MSCRFWTGVPGSCRNGDDCPFGHSNTPEQRTSYSPPSYNNGYGNGGYGGYAPRGGSSSRGRGGYAVIDSKYKYVAPKRNSLTSTTSSPATSPTTERKSQPSTTATTTPAPNSLTPSPTLSSSSTSSINLDSLIYSLSLTETEKEAFGAETFTLGKIPLRPPTKSLV